MSKYTPYKRWYQLRDGSGTPRGRLYETKNQAGAAYTRTRSVVALLNSERDTRGRQPNTVDGKRVSDELAAYHTFDSLGKGRGSNVRLVPCRCCDGSGRKATISKLGKSKLEKLRPVYTTHR